MALIEAIELSKTLVAENEAAPINDQTYFYVVALTDSVSPLANRASNARLIGLVAGGVVGYTAGPSIASSWGLRGHRHYHRAHYRRHPVNTRPGSPSQNL